MKHALAPLFLLALTVASPRAFAGVKVGDTPKLEFKATDGSAVSLDKLRGRIVLVDFWATWCPPCMAMADEMVALNKEFNPKGMQTIGISLDQNRAALDKVVKEKGFAWPQYFDGKGWENAVWKEWGEDSVPFTVILSPEGSVLWKGTPGPGLKAEIEKAFKEHPPKLVDERTLDRAGDLLAQVDSKRKAGDTAGAMKLLQKMSPDASNDPGLAARIADTRAALSAQADRQIAAVDPLIADGKYTEAVAKLKELSRAFAGTPASAPSYRKLRELQARPEVRQQTEAADRAARADQALAAAKALQEQKKDDQAYFHFKDLAADYPGTDAATSAAAEVKRYQSDPAFFKRVIEKEAALRAKAALSMARTYKTANKLDQARERYQSVIKEYPGTVYAETARQELAALGK